MPPTLACGACGKVYVSPRFLSDHERRGCRPSKRALSEMLEVSKTLWLARKKRRIQDSLEGPGSKVASSDSGDNLSHCHAKSSTPSPNLSQRQDEHNAPGKVSSPHHQALSEQEDRRTRRTIRMPVRFLDAAPAPYAPLSDSGGNSELHPTIGNHARHLLGTPPEKDRSVQLAMIFHRSPPENSSSFFRWVSTKRNSFAFVRSYYVDDVLLTLDADRVPSGSTTQSKIPPSFPQFGPFSNLSSFELAEWYWTADGNLSFNNFSQLLAVLQKSTFSVADISCTNWRQAFRDLAENKEALSEEAGGWISDDGWRSDDITIQVPFHSKTPNPGSDAYVAGTLHHRSIVGVIRETLSNPNRSRHFHFYPYRLTWSRHPSVPDIAIQGELYTSPAFLEAYQRLQSSDREPGCSLERIVVGLMFWSDGTVLTSFGGAKLWPCYMYFGNESKGRRIKGSNHLCEHIAYFEALGGDFRDYLRHHSSGKSIPDTFIAFCNRLMFHAQWDILLDDELRHAMEHGIVIRCHDGVERRFYPRIFTYSADYPEKIIIATVRNGGNCPCPRCTVPKSEFCNTGTPSNRRRRTESRRDPRSQEELVQRAHDLIFNDMCAVSNKEVEKLLKPESWTPVINSFSANLGSTSFNIFSTLVVDLLHDFEIGVWKSLFLHLIRLLESSSTRQTGSLHVELNYRYRHMPTFGKDAIRKFSSSITEGKRRAARDYEDILQCAIPAFEDLLPEPHNAIVKKLLYLCAEWHALAKLRLHNDLTLRKLENATILMTDQFRTFTAETCSKIATYELKAEQDARHCRTTGNKHGRRKQQRKATDQDVPGSSRQRKHFSINTYKYHALGDFVDTIRVFGTVDSYSTEVGEKDHHDPKSWFKQTNKKQYSAQIARIERRRARIRSIRERLNDSHRESCQSPSDHENPANGETIPMSVHHTIGSNQNTPLDLQETFGYCLEIPDPALLRFIPKLKIYLFSALKARHQGAFGAEGFDWTSVALEHRRIYSHKIFRIRYTTYDVRRAEDVIHIHSDHSNIMVINPDFDPTSRNHHPYRYAKVLGIYHTWPYLPGSLKNTSPDRVEFLWVHWYDIVDHGRRFELDCLQLSPTSSPSAFGFLDPSEVIRAAHIVPQFSQGTIHNPSPRWMKGTLWKHYYVNRFADCDMFMRFLWGHAIGHTYTWKEQDDGSAYYAEMEDLVSSAYPEDQGGLEEGEGTQGNSNSKGKAKARGGGDADENKDESYGNEGGDEEGQGEKDEGGAGAGGKEKDEDEGVEDEDEEVEDDEDEDEDEEVEDNDEDNDDEQQSEDEWNRHDDEEILVYDDMYEDWYLCN